MFLYAIHDPWFHGRSDGDVDDRAAFCAYDRYLRDHPSETIRVCVGDRLSSTLEHYGHTRISFIDKIQRSDLLEASRILICAPVLDAADREMLREIMAERGNGYAQGCKIGSMNFPNANYLPLLSAVTYPYSTIDTMLTFPVEFLRRLDPHYKDYLSYGCIKLFSPGAIVHIPGLLYRLYCPGIGGGPGTNMLSIQRILQTFGILTHLPIDKDHFIEFNQTLCQEKQLVPIPAILRATDIPELIQSLTVMTYFANLVYQMGEPLYHEGSEIYSLKSLPPGVCLVEDPPPLYDLVAAHWTLYGVQSQEEIVEFYGSL